MYIKQITLRDWKVYSGTQEFHFPEPCSEKNIVLIGGLDGYGKTCLFDAIVLGMFGRDGMQLINNKPSSDGDTYEKFVQKALHKERALYEYEIVAEHKSSSVKIVFIDDDGEPLDIKRVWNFTYKYKEDFYQLQSENFYINEGSPPKTVSPWEPQADERYGLEDEDWYRDYIAENLLPPTLADFFIRDGGRMGVLAKRASEAQVRAGIEGLLGIPVLKGLAKNLCSYATSRRKDYNVSDEMIEELKEELKQLVSKYNKKKECYDKVAPKLNRLKEKRERVLNELSSYGAGPQALPPEHSEHIKNLEEAIEKDRTRLENLMMGDLALALSGDCLRENLKQRLVSEGVLQNWESGREQSDNNLKRFINLLDDGMRPLEPPLSADQHEAVLESARNAWKNVWFPQPANCADGYLHPYLDIAKRAQVTERLEGINQLRADPIVNTLNTIASNEHELRCKREEVNRTESISSRESDSMRKDLSCLNEDIEKLDRKFGALGREKAKLDSQIEQKKKELDDLEEKLRHAQPSIRRAKNAERVALMVGEIVDKAVPGQVNAIAETMTQAHHSMAHKKGLVKRISIDENCNVKLLTSDGKDLRDRGLSEGEKQIFTQALFSAVSSVSKRNFPIVINNPLELLDHDHRKGVLHNLAQKKGQQVILLSNDEEVVGDYLREIDPHIQRKYLLRFEKIGDGGKSTVHLGYFEDAEVRT